MDRLAVKRSSKKVYSREEVSKVLKVKKNEMDLFAREGLFDYLDKAQKRIDQKNFDRLRAAVTLKRDLGVNLEGIDVILAMREKMSQMQSEFNQFLLTVRRQLGVKLVKNMKEIRKKV